MNDAETAVAVAVLLAASAAMGESPEPGQTWGFGWHDAVQTPAGGTAVGRLASLDEPRSEYDRGYRDGAEHLRAGGGTP